MRDDQTDQTWILDLSENALGTGLVFIPNPTLDNPKAARKVFLSHITYETCKQIGADSGAITIKWVPHTVASYAALLATKCDGHCVGTCTRPSCRCNHDTNTCE